MLLMSKKLLASPLTVVHEYDNALNSALAQIDVKGLAVEIR